jgi:hypothetical protein
MNAIRAKIILTWLAFLTWCVLLYFHHLFIAWCLYGLLLLVRHTKPKVPDLPKRVGYLVSSGFIAFLVLVLIDSYYPFPPSVVTIGKIIGVPFLWLLFLYVAYWDYKAFKTTHDTSA